MLGRTSSLKYSLLPHWIFLATVYIIGLLLVDVMDVDAAQYASISMEMLQTGNWLELHHKSTDYLDKPPLVFWLAAFFYQLFGIQSISFKLPSILSSILGFWATYQLGKALYHKQVGQLAALLLGSTQAWVLFNHDIRTDTLLANFCIFAIWQLYTYINNKKVSHFILGFTGIGLAMLAKGPIGAVIPATAIGAYLSFQKEWKAIFHWQWVLGGLLVLLILSPMLYGLWTQYGQEGIYFYFWKQSFGRITGENSWKDNTGVFFFVHTFLWSFLPWSIFALGALIERIRAIWKKQQREYLTFIGFILPFMALSLSHFKLPHYIFPLYPLIAILTANYLVNLQRIRQHAIYNVHLGIQIFLQLLALLLPILLLYVVFPTHSVVYWTLFLIGSMISIGLWINNKAQRLWAPMFIAFCNVNLILNLHFYPQLLHYQSGSVVANYIHKHNIPLEQVGVYDIYQHSFDFKLGQIARVYKHPEEIIQTAKNQPVWLFCDEGVRLILQERNISIKKEIVFQHYHVTKLNLAFLNPQKRDSQLKNVYLLKL